MFACEERQEESEAAVATNLLFIIVALLFVALAERMETSACGRPHCEPWAKVALARQTDCRMDSQTEGGSRCV